MTLSFYFLKNNYKNLNNCERLRYNVTVPFVLINVFNRHKIMVYDKLLKRMNLYYNY